MSQAKEIREEGETDQKSSTADTRLPKSRVFEILSADRRQEVLRYLDRTEETADIGELAEHIAALECECEPRQLSSQQRKRVYVGLYQCHLPKMADVGAIEYDSDRGTVSLTERSDRFLRYLYLEERDTPGGWGGILTRILDQ